MTLHNFSVRCSLSFLAGAFLLTAHLCGFGLPFAAAFARNVTISASGKPLRLITEEITAQTGATFTLDKNLAERKLFCIVRDVPEGTVLKHIARVLGATLEAKTPAAYSLTMKPEVRAWQRAYLQARQDAFQRAADATAQSLLSETRQALQKERSSEVGKLSTLIPEEAWRTLTKTYALAPEGNGLRVWEQGPIHLRQSGTLTAEEKEVFLAAFDKLSLSEQKRLGDPAQIYLALFLRGGTEPCLGIGRQAPDGIFNNGFPYPLPLDFTNAAGERNRQQKQFLGQWLQKHPVPAGAILDFAASGFDTPVVATRKSGAPFSPEIKSLPTDGVTRTELLTALGQDAHVNLIADCYTDNTLLKTTGKSWDEVSPRAAAAYHCVFEEQSGWLLSRQVDWAEKDITEAPYPVFENCFAAKRRTPSQGPFTVQPALSLDAFLAVCGVPHEQFRHIAHYQSKNGQPLFLELWQLLSPSNSPTFQYRAFGLLTPLSRNQLLSSTGVPLPPMSDPLGFEIRRNSMVRATFIGASSPPDASVRLAFHPATDSDTALPPGWWLEVVYGPEHKVIPVNTLPVIAPPPDK